MQNYVRPMSIRPSAIQRWLQFAARWRSSRATMYRLTMSRGNFWLPHFGPSFPMTWSSLRFRFHSTVLLTRFLNGSVIAPRATRQPRCSTSLFLTLTATDAPGSASSTLIVESSSNCSLNSALSSRIALILPPHGKMSAIPAVFTCVVDSSVNRTTNFSGSASNG